jgi:hypothetical protein
MVGTARVVVDRTQTGGPGHGTQLPSGAPDPADGSCSSGAPDVQGERTRSVRGQVLINFFLIITLAAVLVANLPDSVVRTRLIAPAHTYLVALGLGQHWGVFAPNPRRDVIFVMGEIEYSDGSRSTWSIPVRAGLMAYSDYRWQKFGEHLRLDSNQQLWQPFAAYLASQERVAGRAPVRVSLVRRWAELQPPGAATRLGPWRQFVYYTTPVDGAR